MASRQRKVKDEEPTTQAIELARPTPLATTASPAVTMQEAIVRLESVRRFITKALNTGYTRELRKLGKRRPTDAEEKKLKALEIDYGTIPGVNKKFLLQPGAEKICLWLRVRPVYETTVENIPDHPGHIDVVSRCRLMASSSDQEIFSGPLASCTTMESNFRYVWAKIDAKVATSEWRNNVGFPGKQLGTHKCYPVYKQGVKTGDWEWSERHENPNIYDKRNPVRQMAEKRALVKAIRNFGAMSEIFTEDPSEWKLDDESNVPVEQEESPTSGRVVRAPIEQEPEPAPAAKADPGTVEVHFPADNPDVALIVRMPESFLESIRDIAFKNDVRKCWFVASPDAAEVQARAEAAGLKYVEMQDKPKVEEPVKLKNAQMPAKGMVTNVRMPKGEATQMQVLYAGVWCYCYSKPLFEHLAKSVGKECAFLFAASPMPKIEEIVRIGETQFEDGLPVIQQKDR